MASSEKTDEGAQPGHASLQFVDEGCVERSKGLDQIIDDAKRATEKEHKMSLWQGIKLYPKAIGWSILISTCIVMEGYDVCLINNFCSLFSTFFLLPNG